MKTKLGISLAFAGLMVLSYCSKTTDTEAGGSSAGQFDEDSTCVANPPTPTSATSALANGSTLSGKQSNSVLLGTGNTYTISGVVNFACGTELKIQSGVTIKASTSATSGLVIQRGARINAVGTAASPIKMTSDATTPKPGDWGGLTIQGRSTWNQAGGEVTTEFDTGKAGLASGAVTADNSGTIEYVIIEFAGKKLTTTKEWNNLSLYAVGNKTVIDHINLNRGSDDGIEFFGGTVNVKYLISFANGDDMIDWTNGWTGFVQYGIAYLAKNDTTTSRDTDSNLIEADNDSTNKTLTPISNPVIANVAFATDFGSVGTSANAYARIFKFRVGTYGRIYNSVVDSTKGMLFAFESAETIGAIGTNVIAYGSTFVRNYAADGTTQLTFVDGSGTAWFTASTGSTDTDAAGTASFLGASTTPAAGGTSSNTRCLAGGTGNSFNIPSDVATNIQTAFLSTGTCATSISATPGGFTVPSTVTGAGSDGATTITFDTNTTAGVGNNAGALPAGWNAGAWMAVSTTNLPSSNP